MKTKEQDETKKLKRKWHELNTHFQERLKYIEVLVLEHSIQEAKKNVFDGQESLSERQKQFAEQQAQIELRKTQIKKRGEQIAAQRKELEERANKISELKKRFRIKVGKIVKAKNQNKDIERLMAGLQNCSISASQMNTS